VFLHGVTLMRKPRVFSYLLVCGLPVYQGYLNGWPLISDGFFSVRAHLGS